MSLASQSCHQHVFLVLLVGFLVLFSLIRLVISRFEWLSVRLEVAVPLERAFRVVWLLVLVVVISFFIFGRSVNHLSPLCSVSSVEVLLGVVLVTVPHQFVVPPTLLRYEITVLLTIEALIVLMSMEASIVTSQLSFFLHSVVESTVLVLFVRALIIARVEALVLLQCQSTLVLSWNVLTRFFVVITTQLIESFFVEIIALRVEEIASWKHVKAVCIVLARSVFDFLACVLLHFGHWSLWLDHRIATLWLHACRVKVLNSWCPSHTRTVLLHPISFSRRYQLCLKFVGLTVIVVVSRRLVELVLVNFKQVFILNKAIVAPVEDAARPVIIFAGIIVYEINISRIALIVNTQLNFLHFIRHFVWPSALLRVFVLQEIWIFYNLSREINTLQPVHSLLFKLKFSTLDRSRSLSLSLSLGLSIIID